MPNKKRPVIETGRFCIKQIFYALENLRVEDLQQDIAKQAGHAVRVAAILITSVVAVFVTTTETFAEIVIVLGQINVVAVIAVRRILISQRVLRAGTIAVLPVRLSGAHAFFVAFPYSLP